MLPILDRRPGFCFFLKPDVRGEGQGDTRTDVHPAAMEAERECARSQGE